MRLQPKRRASIDQRPGLKIARAAAAVAKRRYTKTVWRQDDELTASIRATSDPRISNTSVAMDARRL
jgi:hypothetical protein